MKRQIDLRLDTGNSREPSSSARQVAAARTSEGAGARGAGCERARAGEGRAILPERGRRRRSARRGWLRIIASARLWWRCFLRSLPGPSKPHEFRRGAIGRQAKIRNTANPIKPKAAKYPSIPGAEGPPLGTQRVYITAPCVHPTFRSFSSSRNNFCIPVPTTIELSSAVRSDSR